MPVDSRQISQLRGALAGAARTGSIIGYLARCIARRRVCCSLVELHRV